MDKLLLERVKQDTPKMNPLIANGLACEVMPYAAQYLDDVLRAIGKDFPEGLKYEGMHKCNPFEEYADEPRKKSDKRIIDIARNNIFLVKLLFSFNGQPLPPKTLYVPFVSSAGEVTLGGARYFIAPVLSDVVLSYEEDNIFVRLLRDKFTLRMLNHNVIVDDVRETVRVVYSSLHHSKKNEKTSKVESVLTHYLFCRYGFTQTFQMFTGTTPVVGGEEIEVDTYPAEDWVIVKSVRLPVGRRYAKDTYVPTDIRVAIPRHKFTVLVKNLLAGFFYIVDNFPERMLPDSEYYDSDIIWKILLGIVIFGNDVKEGQLIDSMSEHIESLDEYMDAICISMFKEIGYDFQNLYQFMIVAIEKFNDWILESQTKVNSLYDKELSVLYDVMMPMTKSFFNFHYSLKKLIKRGAGAIGEEVLTEKVILETLNKEITPRKLFDLTKTGDMAVCNNVSVISYSGDNKLMKITTNMASQKKSGPGSGDAMSEITDKSKRLHVSFAEVGSYANLPNSHPVGDARINPYLKLDSRFRVVRNEELRPLLDTIQEEIKRS